MRPSSSPPGPRPKAAGSSPPAIIRGSPGPMLLDLDGTLIDSLADIAASANHVRAAYHLPPLPIERIRGMVGDGAAKLIERALADAGRPVVAADVWPIYDAHHTEQCTRLVVAYPGVVAKLREWADDRRPVAVVTNKPERFAVRILEHLGILPLVGTVVGGDTAGAHKPSPLPLRTALERLGVGPERAWMAGDGLQDLRAGRAAGVRTVAALYGFAAPDALRAERADVYWTTFGVAE